MGTEGIVENGIGLGKLSVGAHGSVPKKLAFAGFAACRTLFSLSCCLGSSFVK